jgi:hypothetical protein
VSGQVHVPGALLLSHSIAYSTDHAVKMYGGVAIVSALCADDSGPTYSLSTKLCSTDHPGLTNIMNRVSSSFSQLYSRGPITVAARSKA